MDELMVGQMSKRRDNSLVRNNTAVAVTMATTSANELKPVAGSVVAALVHSQNETSAGSERGFARAGCTPAMERQSSPVWGSHGYLSDVFPGVLRRLERAP
jgi:hypothetical protein